MFDAFVSNINTEVVHKSHNHTSNKAL